MALLLRRLRHHFSQQSTLHPAPIPAGHINPAGSLLPPALCWHHFDFRTSERNAVLTFCSHSQLSHAFQEARRGAKQAAACGAAGGRPSLSTCGVGIRPSWIATMEHVGLGRLHLVVGHCGVAILHPNEILLPSAGWEGTSPSPALLAVLGLGRTAASVRALSLCGAIISFWGKKPVKIEQMRGLREGALAARETA